MAGHNALSLFFFILCIAYIGFTGLVTMSIYCKICNQVFQKLITSTHLKKHDMLTTEYVAMFGKDSLASAQYRQERSEKSAGTNNPNFGNKMSAESKKIISDKNKGKESWNKGVVFTDTSLQKSAAEKREERYKNGELTRATVSHSVETRGKISKSVTEYATHNPEAMKTRAAKAVLTKIENNYDFGFFRGHTHTEESKAKISAKSANAAVIRREKSIDNMTCRLVELGFSVVESTEKTLTAECNKCAGAVTYTKQMFQPSKVRENLCPTCYPREYNRSKAEIELFDFINAHIPATHSAPFDNTKRSIDIYIPTKSIGIEYNGLFYHSEQWLESLGNSKTKDFQKLIDVSEKGIRLIQIFEDEWINKKEIVKARLLHILGISSNTRIHARQCVIEEISSKDASAFCNKYHLQGAGRSNVRLGLFYRGELVSVMTFSKNNISRKIDNWELNRFCSSGYSIPGAASKLFSHFVKMFDPAAVVTYADRRWSVGNLYLSLGFEFEKYTVPGYWYLKDNFVGRIHRFSLRKSDADPVEFTERELREKEGYKTIWDSGNSKWVWKSNKSG